MELKDVVGVGQAGLSAVLEEVARVRDESSGQVADSVEEARSTIASAIEEVQQRGPELVAAAAAAIPAARVGRVLGRAAVGVVVIGAATGAGYLIWRKRQQAIRDELSGESLWSSPTPQPETFEPGVAEMDSPDVIDPQLAKDIDATADEIAEELVEAVTVPGEHHERATPPAPQEPFEPGVADADSPDVVDEQFAKEIDEVADVLAEEFVEGLKEEQG